MKRLVGELHWTPPPWTSRITRRRLAATIAIVFLLAASAFAGFSYFQTLPAPPRAVARITPPGITPVVDGKLVPEPLLVEFSVETDPRTRQLAVDSVARIDLVGKTVREGISLTPRISGEWRWDSEKRLRFQPAEDWPAGQRYTVRYEPSLFGPRVNLADTRIDFETPPFQATLDEFVFHQDPVERSIRKVIATLSFTHPVDEKSLRSRLSYGMRESGATVDDLPVPVKFDIQYDALRRTAFVHSAPITIPPRESYLTLHVGEGLAPSDGPSRFPGPLTRDVRIPDIGSYFRVRDSQSIVARNDDNDPVQQITLEFTDYVAVEDLQRSVRGYVLPSDLTLAGESVRDRRWQSPSEVTPEVLAQSREIKIALHPVERGVAMVHSAAIDVPESSSVYLAIDSGLRSEGGFVMSRTYHTVLRVPPYPREVVIAQSGAVLSLAGSHELTFVSRGVSTLRVEIGRLIDREINHLASQTRGDITDPAFTNHAFNADNLTERYTRNIQVNADRPGTASYSSLDLSDLLGGGGQYFITVQGWDRARERALGVPDRRFVLITDLGLLVKANADSTQDVFVHSIASGRPLAGVSVALLGKNGLPLVERTTSAEGHASLPATSAYKREKTPTVFVARNGRDSVFLPYDRNERRLQYSRFDVGGQYVEQGEAPDRLTAQLFTDRGLYRPGDTANLAAIVKRSDWGPLPRLPLVLSVTGPRGMTVMEKRVQLPATGMFDESFATSGDSDTGNYSATLSLLDDGDRRRVIGTAGFRVAEFQPDRLRIRSRIGGQDAAGWLSPDGLHCEVSLQNLFGTPATGRRVTGQLVLAPASIVVPGFEGFTFDDPLRDPESQVQPVSIALDESVTDENGVARLPLPVERYDTGIYRLTVSTEGYEAGGGRSVRARASAMLSPLDYLVGYRAEGNLAFLPKDSAHTVEFVAVDRDAGPVALQGLTLSLIEERYVSALVKRTNGSWAYQSVLREIPVSTRDFEIAAGRSVLPLSTARAGTFAVRIENGAGLVVSRLRYTVAGARNLAGNLERDAELTLAVNGTSFSPGDDITLQITAPYAGSGLITIERDRVYAHKWFTSDTQTSMQSITVPPGLEGNAFVNVAFIRAPDSPDVLVSPLSYAVARFSINRDSRTVQVQLDVPDLVQPGKQIEIGYTASRRSRLVVYAVDEGILQVAGYAMPDPLGFFLPRMALQVDTFQMADLILPEFDAWLRRAAPGGGEAARLAGSNLNPFRRKTEPPVVFWSGVVDAGPDPSTLSFEVPDYFNGELRVMAVAVADAAVGQQQQVVTVRGPFVISPNVPAVAAPGDEFEVTAGVANNIEGSGADALVELSLGVSAHLEIVGDASTRLAIGEGREGRARFRVRAVDLPGPATLTFDAALGDRSTRRSATSSVRPAVPYVTTVQAGSGDADPLKLALRRQLYDRPAQQSITASASPLALIDGLLGYLDAFPHACAEQIVSKVFPQIGFLGRGDRAADEGSIRDGFAAAVRTLRSRQTADGGFRFWATSQEPAAFASVYILHFFTDAAEYGLPVPRDMREQGLGYLRNIAATGVTTLADARLRAYAIYVLTRNGLVTTNYLTNLHEYLDRSHPDVWHSDLTAPYMAASYILLQQPDLGRRLIGDFRMGAGDEMTSDFDTRLGRDAQYVYLLAKHFPDELARLGAGAIEALAQPVLRNRFNTLSSAYAVLALGSYTRAADDTPEPLLVGLTAEQGDGLMRLADPALFARAEIPHSTESVRITGGGGSAVYYSLTQTGFDRTLPESALAEGLEIFREYLDGDDQPVTSALVGDELTVRLRVRSTGRPRSNVAVVDLLPGGFEVVAGSVVDEYGGWSTEYRDVREDRVVIYGTFMERVTGIRYRVRVTSAGDFTVPPAYAGSMYDRSIHARTAPGSFTVGLPQ